METACETKLKELKIEYFAEYMFSECKDTNMLEFDFYVPSLKLLIETDGEQHFARNPYFHKTEADYMHVAGEMESKINGQTKMVTIYCGSPTKHANLSANMLNR